MFSRLSLRPLISFCHCRVETKHGRIRRVKYCGTLILAVLFASLALSEDFKTTNGKVYKDATVSRIEGDGIVLRTEAGSLRWISANFLKGVRNGFIGRNRRRPESLSTAGGQRRPEDRLVLQGLSLAGL